MWYIFIIPKINLVFDKNIKSLNNGRGQCQSYILQMMKPNIYSCSQNENKQEMGI